MFLLYVSNKVVVYNIYDKVQFEKISCAYDEEMKKMRTKNSLHTDFHINFEGQCCAVQVRNQIERDLIWNQ